MSTRRSPGRFGYLILALCSLVMVYMGIWQLEILLNSPRSEGTVMSVQPYRRTTVAQVRFSTPEGRSYEVQVNAEGHQPGETMTLMYKADDPQQTARAYSPWLYLIVAICLLCGGGLAGLTLWMAFKKPQG